MEHLTQSFVELRRSWLESPLGLVAFWIVPPVAMLWSGLTAMPRTGLTLLWALSLGLIAAGCFISWVRTSWTPWIVTGSFFVLMAVVTVGHGFGFLFLWGLGWNSIGFVALVGGVGITLLAARYLE